jgi:hypothetical protein
MTQKGTKPKDILVPFDSYAVLATGEKDSKRGSFVWRAAQAELEQTGHGIRIGARSGRKFHRERTSREIRPEWVNWRKCQDGGVLASDEASVINAIELTIDGGFAPI